MSGTQVVQYAIGTHSIAKELSGLEKLEGTQNVSSRLLALLSFSKLV